MLTTVFLIGSALLLLLLSQRLLGPQARPECPFCGSRVRTHAEGCPWSRRER